MTSTDETPVPDYLSLLRLDGQAFVVVGAGQGIGRQTAHALAQAGASVVTVDVDRRLADEIAAEVGGVACVADARQRDDVERIVAETRSAYGRLDGIVDIVGAARFGDFVTSTDEEWTWTLDMVLRHALLIGQIGGRELAASGGGVLAFVASISGLTSSPQHAVYGAAKAGLMSLVRTLAVELGPSGVKVNAVAPGGTWTPRMSVAIGEEGREVIGRSIPRGRMAVPPDIAAGLLFLCSPLSDFIHGQTLVIDGGGHVKYPYTMEFVTP
jgi:NAD(P)-dependent dehydrogenase (short-subunit alcohol dehydrogenase family)